MYPYYWPYYYWGYWGVYPPGGWGWPTGWPVYYLPPAVVKTDRPAAETQFAKGYTAFWDGDTALALEAFRAATADGNDVRSWYYLALTHRARGDDQAAAEAARVGAAARLLHGGKSVGQALERVQGPARDFLTAAEANVRDKRTAAILKRRRQGCGGREVM